MERSKGSNKYDMFTMTIKTMFHSFPVDPREAVFSTERSSKVSYILYLKVTSTWNLYLNMLYVKQIGVIHTYRNPEPTPTNNCNKIASRKKSLKYFVKSNKNKQLNLKEVYSNIQFMSGQQRCIQFD